MLSLTKCNINFNEEMIQRIQGELNQGNKMNQGNKLHNPVILKSEICQKMYTLFLQKC